MTKQPGPWGTKPFGWCWIGAIAMAMALAGGSTTAYAFGAAEWAQMKADCRNSGGTPSSEYYNDWVDKGGCICPGSSSGSGQATCSGSAAGSSSGGRDLNSMAGEAIAKGIVYGDANMTGLGLGLAFLSGAMQANTAAPQDNARIAAEAAERQRLAEERERLAEQERLAEMQRQEEAKQRILGALKGTESAGELGLKMDSEPPLLVASTQGAFGSRVVVPVRPGALSAGGLPLKLGDAAEQSSAQAGLGFDTAGKMPGADGLPAPPAVPPTYPIAKLEKINVLKVAIKKGAEEQKRLQALLEKLKQAANPEESALKDVQQMLEVKTEDNQKLDKQYQDLTAEDDDVPAAPPPDGTMTRGGQ